MSFVDAIIAPQYQQISERAVFEDVEVDTSVSLISLPVEIQHAIFYYLHPLDVISVGSTCTSLFHSTNDRTLWLRIRRQVNAGNCTFEYEERETTTIRQLKHAATGPARMVRRLKHEGNMDNKAEPEQLIDYPSPDNISPVRTTMFKPKFQTEIRKDTACLYLIPGGRLLITSVGDRLGIWDLDAPGSPAFLAGKRCSPEFIFLVTPSKDRTSFNIAASMNCTDVEQTKLQILTYSASHPNLLRAVETRLEVRRDYDISVFTLIHNLFIYLHLGNIHVWDYTKNTYSSWRVPPPFDSQEFPEMFIHEERLVVIIGERYVVGWDIPTLVNQKVYLSKSDTTLLGTVQPLFSIDITDMFNAQAMNVDTPIIPAFVEKAHDWYTVSSPPQSFDIVWTTDDREYDYFTTIYLDESGDRNNPFTVRLGSTLKLLSLADPISTELDGDRCLDAWRICESESFKGHHRRDGRIFDMVISSESQNDHLVVRMGSFANGEDLRSSENFDRFRFSFDPGSGRICYMSQAHQRVVVIDYLGMDPRPACISEGFVEFLQSFGSLDLYDSDD